MTLALPRDIYSSGQSPFLFDLTRATVGPITDEFDHQRGEGMLLDLLSIQQASPLERVRARRRPLYLAGAISFILISGVCGCGEGDRKSVGPRPTVVPGSRVSKDPSVDALFVPPKPVRPVGTLTVAATPLGGVLRTIDEEFNDVEQKLKLIARHDVFEIKNYRDEVEEKTTELKRTVAGFDARIDGKKRELETVANGLRDVDSADGETLSRQLEKLGPQFERTAKELDQYKTNQELDQKKREEMRLSLKRRYVDTAEDMRRVEIDRLAAKRELEALARDAAFADQLESATSQQRVDMRAELERKAQLLRDSLKIVVK